MGRRNLRPSPRNPPPQVPWARKWAASLDWTSTLARLAWKGHFLDGKTSRRWPAQVLLMTSGLKVTVGRRKAVTWGYHEFRQVQGTYAQEPVRLERGGAMGESLLIPETDFLVHLQAFLPPAALHGFHNPLTRRRRVWLTLVAGLATVAAALLFHFWLIPSLAGSLANRVPLAWEKKLGAAAMDIMAAETDRIHKPRLTGVIDAMVARMAAT